MQRTAGILMPIFSLPSPYGIGTIGKQAYRFADFLKSAGQSIWQILPVGPTSYGDSPYQSFSSYAGNPYFIDLEMLCSERLLKKTELNEINWGDDPRRVDYDCLFDNKFRVLRLAFERFKLKNDLTEFKSFCKENSKWLKDYALFMALKAHFDMKCWNEWDDEDIILRKPEAVKGYSKLLKNEIEFQMFMQFKFFEQWKRLRAYVNSLGIKILGDMPIYVAMDSADAWAAPEVFLLDEKRQPVSVAGCPPDYFSPTGQLWGNPLYNWDYLKENGYKWWFSRIKAASKLYDITRIDHFRAFDEYYSIPYPAENAVIGSWEKGPGIEFFKKMKRSVGNVEIVAEDLGLMTDTVIKLLKDSGYPGMKVLEFAFDGGEDNAYLPGNYKSSNCVVYTGTHDNDTLLGWSQTASDYSIDFARRYCKIRKNENFCNAIIRAAYASVADTAIIQMQDALQLGSEARINTPSTLGGNWNWRADGRLYSKGTATKLYKLAKRYGRLPD